MELPPPLLPVSGHLLGGDVDERPGRGGPQIGELGELSGRAVHGVLDRPVAAIDLLDSARRELEQLRQHELGPRGVDADGEAQQAQWLYPPNARLSLANTPSSERRLWSVIEPASRSYSSRCS